MELSRRGLITGAGALVAAPAVVRAESLMPVVPLPRPAPLSPSMIAKLAVKQLNQSLHVPVIERFGIGCVDFRVEPKGLMLAEKDFRARFLVPAMEAVVAHGVIGRAALAVPPGCVNVGIARQGGLSVRVIPLYDGERSYLRLDVAADVA